MANKGVSFASVHVIYHAQVCLCINNVSTIYIILLYFRICV